MHLLYPFRRLVLYKGRNNMTYELVHPMCSSVWLCHGPYIHMKQRIAHLAYFLLYIILVRLAFVGRPRCSSLWLDGGCGVVVVCLGLLCIPHEFHKH